MKTKPLTFLLALTFLFLFSGSSSAGLFSPDDYNECIFKNMRHAKNKISIKNTWDVCQSKFPNLPKKGPSGMFGPNNYSDCVLKYNEGVENSFASVLIQQSCLQKFRETSPWKDEPRDEEKCETTNAQWCERHNKK